MDGKARAAASPHPPQQGWSRPIFADDWHGISLSHLPKARVGMGTVGYPLTYTHTLQVVLFRAMQG